MKKNLPFYVSILCIVLFSSCFNNQNSDVENPKLIAHNSNASTDFSQFYHDDIDDSFIPLRNQSSDFKPLAECHSSELQKFLETELNKNPKWNRLIKSKKMAVGVVDLSDEQNPRFAAINGKEMMYAASLPKIAVLLAVSDAFEKNELVETDAIKKDMRLMISKSNNAATTRLIDLVGYEKIEEVVRDPKYHLYEEDEGGGLWVGKRYGGGGGTNREPMKNLSHAASAMQVCRFYYMLVNKKLVSEARSEKMLEIMKDPALHHKFVNTLNKIAPNAKLYRKSGSWKSWHSDSVLVLGKKRKYILVALIEDPSGEQIIRNLVVPIERALKIK